MFPSVRKMADWNCLQNTDEEPVICICDPDKQSTETPLKPTMDHTTLPSRIVPTPLV